MVELTGILDIGSSMTWGPAEGGATSIVFGAGTPPTSGFMWVNEAMKSGVPEAVGKDGDGTTTLETEPGPAECGCS